MKKCPDCGMYNGGPCKHHYCPFRELRRLTEFTDQNLIEELELRGYKVSHRPESP